MGKKIIIAGGSGFLGSSIIKGFKNDDVQIVVLTRGKNEVVNNISYTHWDATTLGDWTKELEGADAIINLVGKSVNCRYTKKNKKEIIRSRVDATYIIGAAIKNAVDPPKLWINAGSAAIFGNSGDEIKDEFSSIGEGFSPEVCKQWEAAFNSVDTPFTRKVFLRIGIVFQKNGGLLKPFINLVKFGLGGKIGSGEQYISWIHEEDFLKVIKTVIDREDFSGIINCASPYPVKNNDFLKALRKAFKKSFGLPSPAFLVKIGTFFIGTEAELVLSGRRVVSKILEQKNFSFQYPQIENALNNLLG
ncbi:MAG: TIGR01777 family oxidoreductase [Ferruginibacter sp.]